MRDLLDSSSLRRLKFIESMLEENRWWKTEKIAAQLECSESTVKSDIHYFRLYFSSIFKFETSKQKGIHLTISNTFQWDNFYQQIMRECMHVQFVNLLFYDTFHTLEEYAEELYTSVSSVKRCMEQVKPIFEKYGLTIQQKPIRVQGNEKQIIFFYGVLFWEEYGTSFLKLNFTYETKANELIKTFKEKMNLALSSTLTNKISLWLVLIFERFSKGYHIEKKYVPLLPVSTEIEKIISQELNQLPFRITKEDIQFISYFLESRYIYFTKKKVETTPSFLKVYNGIELFLNILSERTSVSLRNQTLVQQRLFSHYLYKLEFHRLNYSLVEISKITVYNKEGLYDDFTETALDILKELDKVEWVDTVLDDPVDFLYILISTWEKLTTEIIKNRKKINVLIISQFGVYHEKFLEELVHIRYPYMLNSFLLTDGDYPESIELIITDHEVAEIQFRLDNSIPVIGINYSANNHSWDQLKNIIDQIYFQQKENKAKQEM